MKYYITALRYQKKVDLCFNQVNINCTSTFKSTNSFTGVIFNLYFNWNSVTTAVCRTVQKTCLKSVIIFAIPPCATSIDGITHFTFNAVVCLWKKKKWSLSPLCRRRQRIWFLFMCQNEGVILLLKVFITSQTLTASSRFLKNIHKQHYRTHWGERKKWKKIEIRKHQLFKYSDACLY